MIRTTIEPWRSLTVRPRGKLRLNKDNGALYSCPDSSLAVQLSVAADAPFDVGIGQDTDASLKCAPIGLCPLGTQTGLTGGNVSCTLTTSWFPLGLPDWAQELGSSVGAIPLHAWGTTGAGNHGSPGGAGQVESGTSPGGSAMQYACPVTNGYQVLVSLFLAEAEPNDTISGPVERVFNVKVEGVVPPEFSRIDPIALAGAQYRGIRLSYLQQMQDNMLNLEFDRVKQDPTIMGIEIRSLRNNFVSRGPLTSTRQPRPSQCLTLADTGAIVSNTSNFHLVWQDDGDLIITDYSDQNILFDTKTSCSTTPHTVEVLTNALTSTNHPDPAACLQLPGDDGVVLDNGVARLVWRSDGNLVLIQGAAILWESGTADSELGGNGGTDNGSKRSALLNVGGLLRMLRGRLTVPFGKSS